MTNQRIRYKPIDPHIEELAARFGNQPEAVLEIFYEIQIKTGGVSREAISDVARCLRIPEEKAFGVASFYSLLSLDTDNTRVMRVCNGPVCHLKGASEVRANYEAQAPLSGWIVRETSCLGLCDRAPAALLEEEQAGPVGPDEFLKVISGWRGVPTDYSHPLEGEVRVMMAGAGHIDPDSLSSALEHGAYTGLKKALSLTPEQTLAEVESSGLTGRGGAGFPVGRKWRFVAQAGRKPSYVICNADESEPMIFKDRVLIDTNPHQILEGMAIAGYATGSHEAYIYIRGEYRSQAERLNRAIYQAEEAGYLGSNILNSGFSFRIHVHRGAGAYICGEETALIESLEGKRGEPRPRPPYPPSYGYQGQPTLVNNVESYAAVPNILWMGADWYRSVGSQVQGTTPGTKLYMVLGHVNHPCLFEAPFGLTLRQIIDDFGGGMRPGSQFNFALTGGAAGTIVPPPLLDVPIDYPSAAKGVSLGAGAVLICDQTISPVDFLRSVVNFFMVESCGKCTPCRIGTYESTKILNRLTAGDGRPGDIDQLFHLADFMQVASFCGLGQAVAIPVKSALAQFRETFVAAETPQR